MMTGVTEFSECVKPDHSLKNRRFDLLEGMRCFHPLLEVPQSGLLAANEQARATAKFFDLLVGIRATL